MAAVVLNLAWQLEQTPRRCIMRLLDMRLDQLARDIIALTGSDPASLEATTRLCQELNLMLRLSAARIDLGLLNRESVDSRTEIVISAGKARVT